MTDYEQSYANKKTRRQVCLEQMEATLPWDLFLSLIQPVYHRSSAKGGRSPFPLELMPRIHLLQQRCTLYDPLIEETLIDAPCFRRFAGIDPIDGRIHNESAILNFMHLLEEDQVAEQLLERVNQSLRERALLLKRGTILDATIIDEPSSTKNKQVERDPEMHSVAKGNQLYVGMPYHIGVDADSGLVHSVVSTNANVHELNTASERVHGEERVIYGDSGHSGIEKRDAFKDCSSEMRIGMKPGQRRVLPGTPEERLLDLVESAKAHLRAEVEHPFRIGKRQYVFQKVYYRGIKKNDFKLKMLFVLANPWMTRKHQICQALTAESAWIGRAESTTNSTPDRVKGEKLVWLQPKATRSGQDAIHECVMHEDQSGVPGKRLLVQSVVERGVSLAVGLHKLHDLGDELLDAGEAAPRDHPLQDDPEAALHLVQERGVVGRVVDLEVRPRPMDSSGWDRSRSSRSGQPDEQRGVEAVPGTGCSESRSQRPRTTGPPRANRPDFRRHWPGWKGHP